MPTKVVGVPIGTTATYDMPTEFGPTGCTLGLGFLSPNTVSAVVTGGTSGKQYYSGDLPAQVLVTDTADTSLTVVLSGTNVAGQLSMITSKLEGQPDPWNRSFDVTSLGVGTTPTGTSGDILMAPGGEIYLGAYGSTPDSAGTISAALIGTDTRAQAIYGESALTGLGATNTNAVVHLTSSLVGYLDDAAHDYNVALFVENYTKDGSGIVIKAQGQGDGIFIEGQSLVGNQLINLFVGSATDSSPISTAINIAHYGGGKSIAINRESTATADSSIDVVHSVNSSVITIEDYGASTTNDVQITSTAKTTGSFLNAYHATSDMTGDAIFLNLGNGTGAFSGNFVTFQKAGATMMQINAAGQLVSSAGNESTGAGSALLGANCPAVTPSAPYKWIEMQTSDGSAVYVPVWK